MAFSLPSLLMHSKFNPLLMHYFSAAILGGVRWCSQHARRGSKGTSMTCNQCCHRAFLIGDVLLLLLLLFWKATVACANWATPLLHSMIHVDVADIWHNIMTNVAQSSGSSAGNGPMTPNTLRTLDTDSSGRYTGRVQSSSSGDPRGYQEGASSENVLGMNRTLAIDGYVVATKNGVVRCSSSIVSYIMYDHATQFAENPLLLHWG